MIGTLQRVPGGHRRPQGFLGRRHTPGPRRGISRSAILRGRGQSPHRDAGARGAITTSGNVNARAIVSLILGPGARDAEARLAGQRGAQRAQDPRSVCLREGRPQPDAWLAMRPPLVALSPEAGGTLRQPAIARLLARSPRSADLRGLCRACQCSACRSRRGSQTRCPYIIEEARERQRASGRPTRRRGVRPTSSWARPLPLQRTGSRRRP